MELIISGGDTPPENVICQMKEAALRCLIHEGVRTDDIEVSVTFTDLDGIHELNRTYRNVDSSTDVLSFPQYDDTADIPADGMITLGDVVICMEQALLQAEDFGHSAERELVYLFVHSMFHLLGYDHMTDDDKAEMRKAEEDVMSVIGLERK